MLASGCSQAMENILSSRRFGGTLPKRPESGVAHYNSKRRATDTSMILRMANVSGLAFRRNLRLPLCRTLTIAALSSGGELPGDCEAPEQPTYNALIIGGKSVFLRTPSCTSSLSWLILFITASSLNVGVDRSESSEHEDIDMADTAVFSVLSVLSETFASRSK